MFSTTMRMKLAALVVLAAWTRPGWACFSDSFQKTAMCQLAAGFSPLPPSLSSTWKCDSSGNPLTEPCTWAAVACDPLCRVTSLNLGNSGITGTLSSYVGQLTQLEGLFLYSNSIGGQLPFEIGYLQNLQLMTVDHTQLTGAFPKICSGAAPGYTFSPTSFVGLTNLRLLAVDNTNINCYPKCFYKTFSSAGLWAMTEQALTAGYGIYMDPGIPVCPREPINVFISSVYTNHWCSLSSYGHALRDPPSHFHQPTHPHRSPDHDLPHTSTHR